MEDIVNPENQISFTHFAKPNGKRTQHTMNNIRPEAAKYLNENQISVSTEEGGIVGDIIAYFNDGTMMEDDEHTPDELIVISRGRSCEDVMDEGVELLKKRAG